jgi:cell division protein FtsL
LIDANLIVGQQWRVHRLNSEIREIETKQKDIAELQKQIGTYSKTRKVYEAYRKSGWS